MYYFPPHGKFVEICYHNRALEAENVQRKLAACYRALGIANKLRDGRKHKSRIMARANRLRALLNRIGG